MAVTSTASASVGPIAIGTQLSYVQYTANVTISGTTEAAANLIVSATSFVANGTDKFWVDYYSPQVIPANADFVIFVLYDNAAFVNRIATFAAVTNVSNTVSVRQLVTPAAGVHAYDIRGFRGAANGTVSAGVGGTGVLAPGFISITKAAN